jgi:arylsulfatase A-like enzyme/Flp pilus assembly protein TadD
MMRLDKNSRKLGKLLAKTIMSGKIIAWVAVLFVAIPSLCQRPANRAAARSATNGRRPNVLLITIDTLRADHVGCYGAKSVDTPTFDALARDGIVFDRAISQVPLTWPSHATMLTGTYPFQNGVRDFTGHPLSPQFRTIAEAFKQTGYATGAVISSFVLDRSWGLARGFDFYDDAFSATAFQERDLALVDRKAQESVDHALKWLEKTPKRPFFLWLHLYDPHSPYDPPEPYRTLYKDHLYDGEIAYADHELGRLIASLKNRGAYDNSIIALVSDHGESLGNHGEQEHGFFIYNSTIHVPLIIKAPSSRRFQRGHIVRPVEITAIGPTLLEMAGLKDAIQKQFQTSSLLMTEDTEQEAYSETFYPFSSFGWSPLQSLQTKQYQFIEAPEPELYDIAQDPDEKNNLVAQQPAIVAVLKAKMRQKVERNPFQSRSSDTTGLNPASSEKLRALGYVAYQSPVSNAAITQGLADPKSKLMEFNAILRAQDAFHAGDYGAAETLLADVQVRDPEMYLVPFMKGESALRQEKWDEAAREFRNCLKLSPNFDQAMTGLAGALAKTGNSAGAKTWLQLAIEQNPQNFRAWYELARVESNSADKNPAIADYKRVLAIQPAFSLAHRDLGMLYFDENNYSEAAPHLSQATRAGLQDAQLFNFLGICYSRTGQLQKASESYNHALKLDPMLAQAHLNLAYVYQRQNLRRAAVKEYNEACRLKEDFCQFLPQSKLP